MRVIKLVKHKGKKPLEEQMQHETNSRCNMLRQCTYEHYTIRGAQNKTKSKSK